MSINLYFNQWLEVNQCLQSSSGFGWLEILRIPDPMVPGTFICVVHLLVGIRFIDNDYFHELARFKKNDLINVNYFEVRSFIEAFPAIE